MSYEPVLPSKGNGLTNVFGEHEYKVRVLFGSSVITSYRSKDATIARNSAGNYTVTFPKAYAEVTDFKGAFTLHAAGAHLFWSILSSTLDTDGKVIVECRTEAGTATDPASGDKVALTFGVSCDTLNDGFTG